MDLLEWFAGLPCWLRVIVALAFMGIGGLMGWYISLRLALVPFAVGVAMLLFAGKDDSEKNGYHF